LDEDELLGNFRAFQGSVLMRFGCFTQAFIAVDVLKLGNKHVILADIWCLKSEPPNASQTFT
jgi:hypothetical protein